MRFSRNLDLCLEKFPANMSRDAEIGALKQHVRRLRGSLQGSRIGQKIFFLNAELKQLVGHESAGMLLRWRHRLDAQSPIVRVEPEFHPWQFLFQMLSQTSTPTARSATRRLHDGVEKLTQQTCSSRVR